ncbi:hypothetical protein GHK52_07590 [Lactococcus garvieae]|nr:hypothetical protein [Lactococcus garvieae]
MRKEENMALGYCEEVMQTLEVLEETLNQFEILKIEFLEEIQHKIDYRSALLAFALPIVVLFFYLANDFSFIEGQPDRSILEAFLGTFIVSFSLWALGVFLNGLLKKVFGSDALPIGRKALVKQIFPKYSRKRKELVDDVERILDCQTLKSTPIPERYLNLKSIDYIIRVLKLEEVSSLQEAVELLDLEVKNSRIQHTLTDKASTLRATEIINGEMGQLFFEDLLKTSPHMRK